MDEFSFNEMRTWDPFKIKSYCIRDWWQLRISIRIRRQMEFKIPLCNPSGGNLRWQSCQTSITELLWINRQQPKHVHYFHKRAPPQTYHQILNVDPTSGAVNVRCGWNASAWNSLPQAVVQGSGWDSLQIIRNLTSDDLGIPLVVIRPVIAGLKNTRLVHLPDLFEGRG